MHLRRAIASDAEAVLELWQAADAIPGVTDTIEDVRRAATLDRVAFILAVVDEQIVGSIIATFDGWRGNMYRLATHPDHRRKGVASALVAEAHRVLTDWGAKRITALVATDHAPANQFWTSAGYAKDERIARYVTNLACER